MKLYKFRPLANCQDLVRAQEIIESGKFWCSPFWELNDPMEGVYGFKKGALTHEFMQNLYAGKSKCVICSFSGEETFHDPRMWGYYANGFKGIAIEIEVDCGESNIKEVTYAPAVANITNNDEASAAVERILTTKLCCWHHEHEYRFLKHGAEGGPHKIVEIKAVYFGAPYKTKVFADKAQQRTRVREYRCHVLSLKQTAKSKGIKCYRVDFVDGLVRVGRSKR